jgi:hypothetical protein
VLAGVDLLTAAGALVGALLPEIIVLPAERGLGPHHVIQAYGVEHRLALCVRAAVGLTGGRRL